MSRGVGEFGPIQELLPEWMAVLVGLVTQLGDVWFLTLVVAVVYWTRSERREGVAVVAATTLTGLAMIDALKRFFALPRPEQPLAQPETLPRLLQPLYEATGTASGYGFPSGHAFMTTIVYLSLAEVLSIGDRRRRWAGAIGLVSLVCLSRVVLGVHYLVDVVAGVGFGLALLFVARKAVDARALDRGTAAFGLAVLASLLNLLPSNLDENAILLVGASVGAFAGWQFVVAGRLTADARPVTVLRPVLARVGVAVAVVAGLLVVLEEAPLLSAPMRGAAVGLLTAGIVTLPVVRHSGRARTAWTALRFWGRMALLGARKLLEPETRRRLLAAGRRAARRSWAWVRSRVRAS